MIRSLRRRFVLTAMLSLLVLLAILIGGIIGASYFFMEKSTDQALEVFLSDTPPPAPSDDDRLPFFGYQISPASPLMQYYAVVIVDAEQEVISIDEPFNSTNDDSVIRGYVLDVLAGGKSKGKIGSYKYLLADLDNGGIKIAFLDVSAQAQMLAGTMRISGLVAVVCIVLMFIILIVVSRRTVRPIADSIDKQRRFVTDAGHEIKTPLAIIQANVDAMELHQGDSKWSKHIREQSVRLDGLMKQLLSLSKMDEADVELPFEDVNLSRLVEKCLTTFSEVDNGKEKSADIAPYITLRGNPDSLEQLITILLDNAMKYSGDHGSIMVRLFSTGRKKVLEVVNTCPVLPDAPPEALFDRFYRADVARTQTGGGYGIGLSIARAITEAHRGKIDAFYDDLHTICFRVELG